MGKTKIEWTETSWNPISGCSKISPGCKHCYAERMAQRLKGRYGYPADNPFQVTFHPERLEQPLHWKIPCRIFVCSMGDLFHDDVEECWIDAIFDIIRQCPQHTFQILTKRAARMQDYVYQVNRIYDVSARFPRNVWLGVSVESPDYLKRLEFLSICSIPIRFVSIEPFLFPFSSLEIQAYFKNIYIDWVIVGAESGPHARPMQEKWVLPILHQCQKEGIPFFYKQRLKNGKKISLPFLEGRQWNQMPETHESP